MNQHGGAINGVLFCAAAGLATVTGIALVIVGTWASRRGVDARRDRTGRLLRRVVVAVAALSAAAATAGLLWR
ncbi:MAG TPA: hypothetical protein VFH83_08200 [Spirochaetia bacterium]|nr:hypothetical protein [Spirochaetia bacterium]